MLVRRLLAFGALAFAAVGVLTTSTAATAAGSKCVALVVDSTHVGGSVSSACVTVATSASGSDVLVAGHHKVTFDPRYGNDFVCAIDGVPARGCHATDDTHYWAYYHRAPGRTAWHISQEGAGTYRPANASTEGWVYDDGDESAPRPRDVPYASICRTAPKSPTPTASPSAMTAHVASPSAAATKTAPASPPRPRHSATTAAITTVTTTAAAAPSPTAAATRRTTHRLHRVPFVVIGAVIAAGGLGAAAVVRLRRSAG